MAIKAGDFVKLLDNNGCDCAACEEAKAGYHRVTGFRFIGEESCILLSGVESAFPTRYSDWQVRPNSLENK